MNAIDILAYTAPHHLEGSWGSRPIGETSATMTLYNDAANPDWGMIEWDVDDGEFVEHIGLWFTDKTLTDYDGVMSFPPQAIELLERNGYTVGEDFR